MSDGDNIHVLPVMMPRRQMNTNRVQSLLPVRVSTPESSIGNTVQAARHADSRHSKVCSNFRRGGFIAAHLCSRKTGRCDKR